MAIWKDAVTDVSTDNAGNVAVGTLRVEGSKCYERVRLSASSGAAAAGSSAYGVITDATYTTLAEDGIVSTATSATLKQGFRGVFLATVAAGSYCWIQTWGQKNAILIASAASCTVGDAIVGSATTGICSFISLLCATAVALAGLLPKGTILDITSVAGGNITGFLRVRSGGQ